MMLVLKIPIVYLGLVVYWAVKAEPEPPEPARLPPAVPEPEPRSTPTFPTSSPRSVDRLLPEPTR